MVSLQSTSLEALTAPGVLDKNSIALVKSKLAEVRKRGYIVAWEVHSLTSYLSVAKGDSDIRMVYNIKESGLNVAVCCPYLL